MKICLEYEQTVRYGDSSKLLVVYYLNFNEFRATEPTIEIDRVYPTKKEHKKLLRFIYIKNQMILKINISIYQLKFLTCP